MKLSAKLSTILLTATVLLNGLATGAYAQSGEIALDNVYSGTSTNSSSTTNGLFWIQTNGSATVLINQDFNAAFYGGTNSTNLTLISTFLVSNGSATGDNSAGPGTFLDPTGAGRIINGASSSAFFQIQAWLGNYTNYSSAVAAGAYARQSPVFSNSVAEPPGTPADLTAMPAIVLTAGGLGSWPLGFTGDGSSSDGASSSGGGLSPSGPSGPLDLTSNSTTCGLWLSVSTSNTTAIVTLHNTRQGETYLLWSTQVVSAPFTNWSLEASVVGAAGDTTQTNIAMNGRSDLFFRATEYANTNSIFQGLDSSNTSGANPDTMGAVGPNYFCELLNGKTTHRAFVVYDKSGTNGSFVQASMTNFFSVHDRVCPAVS